MRKLLEEFVGCRVVLWVGGLVAGGMLRMISEDCVLIDLIEGGELWVRVDRVDAVQKLGEARD